MTEQVTNTIAMVRPVAIRNNEQTAVNNYYQQTEIILKDALNKALQEFDLFVNKLKENGIYVIVIQDTKEEDTPDAHFPNNWISFHENGTVALYPMFAENRRKERREDALEIIETKGFQIKNIMDYTSAEKENVFLEGTGSMILDRVNRKAYCALSQRANEELFIEFCEDFEYTPVIFTANQTLQNKRLPIYHTNVMMCVASSYAIICLKSIDDKKEQKNVIKHLKQDGKEIIDITEEQVKHFAGNMLQVKNKKEELFLVMSSSAYKALTISQIKAIKKHNKIIHSPLATIETLGGGSARCMMAEIFLPKI